MRTHNFMPEKAIRVVATVSRRQHLIQLPPLDQHLALPAPHARPAPSAPPLAPSSAPLVPSAPPYHVI
ncbi:unnamed protein product [Sphagnum balticum]